MSKTVLFYNSDFHKQSPVKFSECYNMKTDEMLRIFYSGRYRKNTGTFLMTDALAKNIDAIHVKPHDLDLLSEIKPDTIITNALHCISPKFVFDKNYWQKILDLNAKLVPMTFGFRYHENNDFYLSDDMIYILSQISERNEIGVRGECTAEILDSYGVKNVKVVGCHSLFYNMNSTTSIECPSSVKSINFNFNQCYSDFFQSHRDFCATSRNIFYYFYEIYKEGKVDVDYTMQTAFYKELTGFDNFSSFNEIKDWVMKKGRYFFSVDDWKEALIKNDISMGTQFHGTVASILAGVPALMFCIDKRMEELAKYHKIPFVKAEQFDPSKSLEEYINECDYTEYNKFYSTAFNNFLDYCKDNGVNLK